MAGLSPSTALSFVNCAVDRVYQLTDNFIATVNGFVGPSTRIIPAPTISECAMRAWNGYVPDPQGKDRTATEIPHRGVFRLVEESVVGVLGLSLFAVLSVKNIQMAKINYQQERYGAAGMRGALGVACGVAAVFNALILVDVADKVFRQGVEYSPPTSEPKHEL